MDYTHPDFDKVQEEQGNRAALKDYLSKHYHLAYDDQWSEPEAKQDMATAFIEWLIGS